MLKDHLQSRNIGADNPVEQWGAEQFSGALENTSAAYAHNLSLPIYPALSVDEQEYIISSINEFFS